MAVDTKPQPAAAGITFRSVCAILACMLLMGMYVQVAEVILCSAGAPAEQALPIPVMVVLLGVILLGGLVYAAARVRILTRQEMLCVFFAMLLAAPMTTQGMWHRFLGLIAATPRTGSFAYMDAFSDRLWPHGDNLLRDALSRDKAGALVVSGNAPRWEAIEYEEGRTAELPVLQNAGAAETSSVTLVVPVRREGAAAFIPEEPHLLSILVRAEGLGADSLVFCRARADDAEVYTELVGSVANSQATFLHKKGFARLGAYGTRFPDCRERLRLEIGLKGQGRVALHDVRFFNVSALEYAYKGRKIIEESAYEALPPGQRAGLVVKPDNMWSPDGLAFLLSGYIPVREWAPVVGVWGAFILLVLAAVFAVVVVMRRQWIENERYPLPLARIPLALMGGEEDGDGRALPAIWRNGWFWGGLAFALAWGLLKGANFYNSKVPDTNIVIPLGPYFLDPGWGQMWNITFNVSIFLVAIAIFFELNVLLSLVVGFLCFRALFWVGEFSNLGVHQGYPFRHEQTVGAYIGYALVVAFFTRKYLWAVLKRICGRGEAEDEVLSYRAAVLLLLACFAGAAAWAAWVGVPAGGILVFFAFLVLVGFVAAKLRAECGLPSGYFTPYNAMLFMSLLGGMTVFGAEGMMVCALFSGFLTVSVFFFIPGAQVELMECGRRLRMRRSDVAWTCLLGLFGGLVVGGWVFLTNAYALGGDNIRFQWAFNQEWFFSAYRAQLGSATADMVRAQAGKDLGGAADPATWGYVAGAAVTAVLTALRQFFAGFWFHPIGFMLGATHMLEFCWGSVLAAWLIRSTVLFFGGAATVRGRLQPFFVGALVGAVLAYVFFDGVSAWLVAGGDPRTYGQLP